MTTIEKKLIKYNFSTGNDPKYIVVHDTGNPGKGADADAHYRYFNGGNRNASAHYFVDDHSIIQTVEDANASWHCGDGKGQYGITNYNSIGIEICINSDGDYNKAVQNAIDLVKFLMKKHNISLDKVVRHYDASRKNCPGTMSSNNWEKWNWFKGQLKEEAAPVEGLYRVRKSWDDAKSQVGAYKVLENAKAECDKNPGYSVFDEKGNKVYPLPSSVPEQPGETQPEQQLTLIMGKTEATAAQMVSYALKSNTKPLLPNCTIEELAQVFIEEAEVEGVRADVAWAQSLKETGYFKYGGIVLPEQNNYSGIGALNNNSKGEAAVFESPRIGARAQIQHLKAYASTEALKQPCVDPRFHLVKRGSAKYVEWLGYEDNPNGTGWAWPGKGYGYSIVGILKGILQEPKESKEATDTGNVPQWQKDAFKKLVEKKIINSPEFWEGRLGETITIGEVMGILANTL
jgi:hypothetical protein